MAKIKVMGDTVQICSSLTVEDIKKAKFYMPTALELRDEKGEPYFAIDMGNAHFGKNGIMFSSKDHEGKAFMTTNNPIVGDHSNRAMELEALTKKFAGILNNLSLVEEQIEEAMCTIEDIEMDTAEAIMFVDEAIPVDPATFEAVCEESCDAPCTPSEEPEPVVEESEDKE